MHAVNRDGRVGGRGRAAEDEDIVTGAEDEQVAEVILQCLRAERRGRRTGEQERPKQSAHGPSE